MTAAFPLIDELDPKSVSDPDIWARFFIDTFVTKYKHKKSVEGNLQSTYLLLWAGQRYPQIQTSQFWLVQTLRL